MTSDRRLFWIAAACAAAGFIGAASAQDQASIEAGEALYDEHCAMCHGEKLRTSGAVPDLRELRADQRGAFVTTVNEGKGQMPAWGGVLSDGEIGQLWSYIQAHAR
jgi:cytochrome c6